MNIFGWTISSEELKLALLAISGPAVITVACLFAMGRERIVFGILFIVVIVACLAAARG